MGLSPGDRVDRYEVIELLGAGGMGEVYRARDAKLARLVALKILRVESGPGTDGAARLLREARAAASLSHASVVAVYDVGEVHEPPALRGLAYIAMELVVGKSLRAYLGDGSVPLERRVGWLRDVALALGAAHQAGIVHRDVKPENVMIRADGAVKVLDFGIARRVMTPIDRMASTAGQSIPTSKDSAPTEQALATLTEQGQVIGTPYYMAPEQLRAEGIDGRADQFAWGVMAYELLTGVAPWQKDVSPLATVSEILSVTPRAPIEVEPRIPRRLSDAILRALAKPRGARFPTMEALVASIDGTSAAAAEAAAVSAPPGESPPTQELAPSVPRVRPRAVARGLFVAAGAVLGIAAVVLVLRAGRRTAGGAGTGAATTDGPAGEGCTSNAQCVRAHGGAAWSCHSKRRVCVELASEDCKVYAEAHTAEAEDVVWIGGMFPLSTDPGLIDEMRATDLARQDFAQVLGSSAGRTGALHARPIGLVICDEGTDAVRAAHHLADDVEVPAVIGFRSTAKALTTIPTVFLPNRVLSFVTISQAPAMTKIPEMAGEPRLVWRSTLNKDDFAMPLTHLISDVLEPAVRAGPTGIGARPFKVAAVWPKSADHSTVESLFEMLRFNSRSALENGANFRQFVYESEGDAGAGEVVDNLLAFEPQVILFAYTAFAPKILLPLEARWTGGPRPFYLTASGIFPSIAEFAGHDSSRRRRFFAVTNLSTTMANAQLVLRYNVAFPEEPIVRTEAPQPSYDAFYVLAYAIYALGDGAVSGPALSRAFAQLLPPGPKFDVGPAQIFDAFKALRTSGQIDINGAMGSLDFDPATGDAAIDYSIICLGLDDNGAASATIDSGLVYDTRAKKLIGTLSCP